MAENGRIFGQIPDTKDGRIIGQVKDIAILNDKKKFCFQMPHLG
jgi:hypothetical protein